jgi:hypothetical protein
MWNIFKKATPPPTVEPTKLKKQGFMTTDSHFEGVVETIKANIEAMLDEKFREGLAPFHGAQAAGTMDNAPSIKAYNQGGSAIPVEQIDWFASQTFIGYQLMAMISQHWLIKKCCLMPAKDAVRNGYEITVNDGVDIDPKILDAMRKLDEEYRLKYNLIQLVDQGRIFGIRIAMFIVDSDDKDYYFKPFNPDGVTPGSYKGISQIDPYWITPQLDTEAAGAPASIHFYEPTWWNIAGRLVHRTHLVVFRTEEVPDILKPVYIYGGVSIPQKIYERVYAAERTANEAPLLALTKRTDVIKTDLSQATASGPKFFARVSEWVFNRNNYGIKVIGEEEEMQQFDTSLADLDAVIMTQYQLVSAASGVPADKLIGTTPKGFNATGAYEESSYHEELESIQAHDLTPLIERHHLLLIRSEICPAFGIKPFSTSVVWKPLDAMTAKELAELNKLKADTGNVLSQSGAIDGSDERERLILDPESGYNGMIVEEVPSDPEVNENDWDAAQMGGEPVG